MRSMQLRGNTIIACSDGSLPTITDSRRYSCARLSNELQVLNDDAFSTRRSARALSCLDSGTRDFSPRLPHQPIFYPVNNVEYAIQIARDWNTKESSFAGMSPSLWSPNLISANLRPIQWDQPCTSNTGFPPNSFRSSMLRFKDR